MPAALQAVTQPLSAPEEAAMARPAAACSSSRTKKWRIDSAAAAAISGSTMAPPRWVILPQALITRRSPYLRCSSMLSPWSSG